jgi:hypothetical protein
VLTHVNDTLRNFDLSNNGLTDGNVNTLLKVIRTSKSLKLFGLDKSEFSKQNQNRLSEAATEENIELGYSFRMFGKLS